MTDSLSLSLHKATLLPVPVPGWRPGHYLSGSCSYVTFQPVHKSTTFSIDRRKRAVLPHKIGCFSRWIMCTGSWYMCICMLAVSAWKRMCWLGADTNHSYFVVLFRFSSRLTRETFGDIFSLPSTWNKYLNASLPIFFFIACKGKKHIDECFYAEISWNLIYWFVWESMGFDGSPYSKKSTSENKCTHFFLFWEVFGNNESKINDLRNQRNNAFI